MAGMSAVDDGFFKKKRTEKTSSREKRVKDLRRERERSGH
jgi:hypothetical protein